MTLPAAGHGTPAPDACSVGFDRLGASAFGTAARARFFVALEQNGPWGRDAATQSHLPAELGSRLSAACTERSGRFTLLRRPGRHPDAHHSGAHAAYLAFADGDPWLLRATVDDPAALLAVDLDALARGDRDAAAASLPGAEPAAPVLLVCTNGRRDVCCAVRGRPVAVAAAVDRPGRVWEASHTGGHRFAPTGVLLPHGATFARLDPALATAVLDEADRGRLPVGALGPLHDRGRSPLDPDGQAAESWVRSRFAVTGLRELRTMALATASDAPGEDAQAARRYAVEHVDGRRWLVRVDHVAAGELPESCGKAPVPVTLRAVTLLA